MDGWIYPFRGHIWAEGDRICRLEDLSCRIYMLLPGRIYRSEVIYVSRVSGQIPEMPTVASSSGTKCTPESPPPMTRLLVVAGLSYRPPGLPGITTERTPPPLSPMGVTGLTPRSQGVAGLTTERQPPVPMLTGIANIHPCH